MGLRNSISSWIVNRLVNGQGNADDNASGAAGVPARPGPRPLAPVGELVDEDEPPYTDDMVAVHIAPAASHFERYRALIDSFDEDRETLLETLMRRFFLLLAYVLPLAVAYAMGKEIGDAYGGAFSWSDGWSFGTHVVAMAGEFALAMMTLSAATALRKLSSDAGYLPRLLGSLVSFLLFSLASGLAQWFIASHHVVTTDKSGLAALIFRVGMVPAVDIASLLFLAVMQFKSLKRFVADQRTRAQAIRDINEAELEIQRAQSAASRRETEERQDLLMKEQRNQVWLELDRLHAQSMIAHARRQAYGSLTAPEEAEPDALPAPAADAPSQEVKIRRIERNG